MLAARTLTIALTSDGGGLGRSARTAQTYDCVGRKLYVFLTHVLGLHPTQWPYVSLLVNESDELAVAMATFCVLNCLMMPGVVPPLVHVQRRQRRQQRRLAHGRDYVPEEEKKTNDDEEEEEEEYSVASVLVSVVPQRVLFTPAHSPVLCRLRLHVTSATPAIITLQGGLGRSFFCPPHTPMGEWLQRI
jgi:hypothetical protein